jgi:hypothetical protein
LGQLAKERNLCAAALGLVVFAAQAQTAASFASSGVSSAAPSTSLPTKVQPSPTPPTVQVAAASAVLAVPLRASSPKAQADGISPGLDWVTRSAAGLGVLLGLTNFWWTFHKSRRDRRLSVEDDFWFRKVVSPASVEPVLELLADLVNELPSLENSQEEIAAYALKVTKGFQASYAKLALLELLSTDLPGKVIELVRQSEDCLTEHVGEIAQGRTPSGAAGPNAWAATLSALKLIKALQLRH